MRDGGRVVGREVGEDSGGGRRSAVQNGLVVGLLVAMGPLFGLLGPPEAMVAVITVAIGLLGGWLGGRASSTDQRTG